MEIVIDIDNAVPLFAQVIAHIKGAVLSGELTPGESLPSIRQLANDLELNKRRSRKPIACSSVIQSSRPEVIAAPSFIRTPRRIAPST